MGHPKTFLQLYNKIGAYASRHKGNMSTNDGYGLCHQEINGKELIDNKIFMCLCPSRKDFHEIDNADLSSVYWASGLSHYDPGKYRQFTPLRQTILAFCAVLENDEEFIHDL